MAENQIGDAGIEALFKNGEKFHSLVEIRLSQNKITDAGVKIAA